MDDRFLLRTTREFQTKIHGFEIVDSFKAIEIYTYAFSHYYNLLGNLIWGCNADLLLVSLKIKFIFRLVGRRNYRTLSDARNNIVTDTPPRRGVDQFLDIDKALPYVADLFEKSEQLYYQNLFLVSSQIFINYFNSDFVVETRFITPKILKMPLTFSDISNKIPDFDGSSKNGIRAFIKKVDELIFDTEDEAVDQRRLICDAAKMKLKGSVADVISSMPVEWQAIRSMLVLMLGSNKTTEQIKKEMISLSQGDLKLDDYYAQTEKLLTDLITKATAGAKNRETANQRVTEAKTLALQSFIKGLNTDLYVEVHAEEPVSLELAYQLGKNKLGQVEKKLPDVSNSVSFDILQSLQNNMFQEIKKRFNTMLDSTRNINNKNNNNTNYNKPKNKKLCEFHGWNFSHNTIRCNVLRKRNQGTHAEPRHQNYNENLNSDLSQPMVFDITKHPNFVGQTTSTIEVQTYWFRN